jgi:hypothetical protein
VTVHRKAGKGEDVAWRAVLEIPTGTEDVVSLDGWRSVLAVPELRKEWDPAVESAQLVEMFDPSTRVAKTMFTLGWPARYVRIHLPPSLVECATTHSFRTRGGHDFYYYAMKLARTAANVVDIIHVTRPRTPLHALIKTDSSWSKRG